MKNIFFLFIVLSFFFDCFPQEDTLKDNLDAIEELIESSLETEDETEIANLLEDLSGDPININTASINELLRIPFISNTTATKIYNYRQTNGYIFSILELFSIRDIDKDEILKSQKYLVVEKKVSKENVDITDLQKSFLHIDWRSRFISAIESSAKNNDENYLGNKFKIYNKAKVNYSNKFKFGILTEKDAGENNYADFISLYLFSENIGPINKIIAGDYNIEFGQGLAMWAPYGLSKGGNSVKSIFKSNKTIKPYLSTNENLFFRGTALSTTLGLFGFTAFYSSKKIDASIDSLNDNINSLISTGYHRTNNELSKKRNVNESIIGSILNINLSNQAKIEFLYYRSMFEKSFNNYFNGSTFNCYAASYKLNFNNMILFGETSWNNSVASINNIQFNLSNYISACFSYRNYSHDYFNFYGHGFGENSGNTRNEIGFYSGINIKSKYGSLNFYFDQFKFPFSSSSVLLPMVGREYYIEYSSKLINRTELLLRYRNEKKQVIANLNNAEIVMDRLLQNIKFEIKYQVSSTLRLKTRVDYVHQFIRETPSEDGYFLLQDVNIKPINRLNIFARIIVYNTDSYDTRLYEYENDLDGVLTSALLYGKGLRWYLLMKYELLPGITLTLKYREHFKLSDNNLTTSNYILDNYVSLQLELNL